MRVGILGGGQLGRMLALAGRPLGLTFRVLEPKTPAPVDELGEIVRAAYGDVEGLAAFTQDVHVVTYEFENIPAEALDTIGEAVPVHPTVSALQMASDRVTEKTGFQSLGIPTARFQAVDTREQLEKAIDAIGLPAVLKTRRFGYDGKGQAVLQSDSDTEEAWTQLGDQPLILEAFADFSRELSLVAARSVSGEMAFYPLVENVHVEGILHTTLAPAPECEGSLTDLARGYVRSIMESLDYVGVMALELFEVTDADGEPTLLANEMAPRVHNSGHWSQDGAVCSQFENHLRAITGLALGSTEIPAGHAGMVNIIGDAPPLEELARLPGARIHLYGKSPRPGRKLGHVNVTARSDAEVRARIAEVVSVLEGSGAHA